MPKGDVERPAPGRRLVGPHVIELLPVVPGMGAELVDAVDVFDVKAVRVAVEHAGWKLPAPDAASSPAGCMPAH